MTDNDKNDLFLFCTHCGELVDVNAAKDIQLNSFKIKKYSWGVGASKKGLQQLDTSPPFLKKTWLP